MFCGRLSSRQSDAQQIRRDRLSDLLRAISASFDATQNRTVAFWEAASGPRRARYAGCARGAFEPHAASATRV